MLGCCGSMARFARCRTFRTMSAELPAEQACHYREPHVRCIVHTPVMCQSGRARAAGACDDIQIQIQNIQYL